MKKYLKLLVLAFILLISVKSHSQVNIQTNNGQTITTCAVDFYDNASGNYLPNVNQTITFQSNSLVNTHIRVNFTLFDVDVSDTLYVYNGLTVTAPLIGKYNNSNPLVGGQNTVQSTITNVSGALTFKFVTNGSVQKSGWFASVVCIKSCQQVIAEIDTILTKPKPDSNYIDICLGDTITFVAKGNFPENNIAYHQSVNNCLYTWDFGDGVTIANTVNTVTHVYNVRKGFDIMLVVKDSAGCVSTNAIGTRVRISSQPTMYIQSLPDMCSGDVKLISVGYDPNSVVLIEPMGFTQTSKQGFDSTLFLPDGPICPPGVYNTFVVFNNFPTGSTIQAATDILAICVNMEHSYAGDLGFRIYCPNGQNTILDPNTHSGGNYLGIPFGGTNHSTYDNGCIPANNPPGTGWNYCWSEFYPNNNTTMDQLSSSGGAGTVMVGGARTIDSTNQMIHANYIKPQNPLSSLIGCPLNGTWNIEIIDDFQIDNGYIFNWNLELTANLMPGNWTYNVKIDSVGFSGPFIVPVTDTTAIISPTIGGNYLYHISLVDEFGCVWDTTTPLVVITTPHPKLGNDTAVCYPNNVVLNPGSIGTIYSWITPSGIKTTQSVLTDIIYSPVPNIFNYIVSVSNVNLANTLVCTGLDTIKVIVNPTPDISFTANPLSGCEPFSVTFNNETTPSGSSFTWNFGDGSTSNILSPTHIFTSGSYLITLHAVTIEGCAKDWSSEPAFIISYPQPIANFTWSPEYGTRTNPTINFVNMTTPNSGFNWNWYFASLATDFVQNPTYKFPSTQNAEEYLVKLVAISNFGCVDSVSYKVKIIDDILVVPNIMTPNEDGLNDFFEIGGLIRGGAYTETQVIIYNRWGMKVYENDNYKNDFGGQGLPDGVYFVTVKAKGLLGNFEHHGSLQILR